MQTGQIDRERRLRRGRALRRLLIAGASVLALPAVSAAQSFTIKYDAEGETSTRWISASAVRAQSGKYDIIDRVDRGTVIIIDHAHKTYRESPVETLKQAMSHSMNEELANMSPRERERAHQMGIDAEPTLTDLGPGETIAGYPTRHYAMKSPVFQSEVWITQALQLPDPYYRDFNIFNANTRLFGSNWGKLMELRGVILKRIVSVSNGRGSTPMLTETAVSVERSPIPAATFDVPAGYTKATK